MKKSPQSNHPKNRKSINIFLSLVVLVLSFLLYIYFSHIIYDATKDRLVKKDVKVVKNFQIDCLDNGYLPFVNDCSPQFKQCGRAIIDGLVSEEEISQLITLANTGMVLGGGSGGPTILDLHSGALSYGSQFINVYDSVIAAGTRFSPAHIKLYIDIVQRVKDQVVKYFPHLQKNSNLIQLSGPTFFARIDAAQKAKTVHDEYWHPHNDTVAYPSFCFTGLLYLTTYEKDFEGGRFVFTKRNYEQSDDGPMFVDDLVVEPKIGRLLIFSSGGENEHYVEKVTSGKRFVLTIAFTCDPKKYMDPKTLLSKI
eukprot:c7123_g1_i1.p1 GENE.c7123_g1_i1~~c7123_g1_i1.p1  ORF type:complete len:319 (-),score=88.54 c7123_g1_i1:99-1028(-)